MTGGRGGPMSSRGPMQGGRGRGRYQQPEETFDHKINMEIPCAFHPTCHHVNTSADLLLIGFMSSWNDDEYS